MRRILPGAVIAALALAGCASAGGPAQSSAPTPPQSQTPAPTAPGTAAPEPTEQTADPQPSEIAGAPYRIEDEAILGAYSLDDIPGDEPLVAWSNRERTLVHVLGTGSGTEACQPNGESIEVDDGMLEIDFEWAPADAATACTADLRVFGWAFPIAGADASITQAVVDDWTLDADDITVEVRPAMGMR